MGECHSLSYDALTAHVAVVFARYLMIALEQRKSEDNRTLGEIFFFLSNELEDISYFFSYNNGQNIDMISSTMPSSYNNDNKWTTPVSGLLALTLSEC